MALLDEAEKKVSRRDSDNYSAATNMTHWNVDKPFSGREPSGSLQSKDNKSLGGVASNTKSASLPGTSGDKGLLGGGSQFIPSYSVPQSFLQPMSQTLGMSSATLQAPPTLPSTDPFAKYFPPKPTSTVSTNYEDKLNVDQFRPSVSISGTFSSSLPSNSQAHTFTQPTTSQENLGFRYEPSQTELKRPSSTSKLESMLNQITSLQGPQFGSDRPQFGSGVSQIGTDPSQFNIGRSQYGSVQSHLSSDRPPSAPVSQFSASQATNQYSNDRPPSAPIPSSMLSHTATQFNPQSDSLSQPQMPSFTSLPPMPGFGIRGFNPGISASMASSMGPKPSNSGPSLSGLPLRAQHPAEMGYSLSQPDPRTTGSWNHRL